MKKGIIIGVVILLILFIGYKCVVLTKYYTNERDIDKNLIFNETLTIESEEYDGDYISIGDINIANYFTGYVDINEYLKAKYDENNTITSFYSINISDQYVEMLDIKNFELATDSTSKFASTSNSVRKYLDKHNITNDIDLLNYIKDNYYFKNTIFTRLKNIKMNYLLNTFVDVTLPNFGSISLINGYVDGYIYNISNSNKLMKEIHILKDNKQYTILLAGEEVTNDEFVIKLLSTVKYN